METGLPHPVVFLLTIPRLFFCCSYSLFVCRWFLMWRLFCYYVFLISPSFGASGRLRFVMVAFPVYISLIFLLSLVSPISAGKILWLQVQDS